MLSTKLLITFYNKICFSIEKCNFKMNHIKDHVDYFKMPQSESKVREISQPVKIAQLFGHFKPLQTAIKDSAVKISQPERITPYMKNSSTKKKDPAVRISQPERITPYMKNISGQTKYGTSLEAFVAKNGTNIINKFHCSEKNVRRNLKFTKTPLTARETNQVAKTSMDNLHNKPAGSRESIQTNNRRSCIIPPDSIKNKYITQNRFKQGKSMFSYLSQTHILMKESVNRCATESENFSLEDASVNNPIVQEQNNKTSVIQHTSSQIHEVKNQSNINIVHSITDSTNVNNDAAEKKILNHSNVNKTANANVCSNQKCGDNVTVNKSQIPFMHNIDATRNYAKLYNGSYLNLETNAVCTPGVEKIKCEDLCAPLHVIKTIRESCVNLQHDIDDDHEYITLGKKELDVFSSNLEFVIYKMEENILCLKSVLTYIRNLSTSTTSKVNDNEIEHKQQMTENSSGNAELINNTSTMSSPCIVDAVVTEVDRSSEGASKTFDSDELVCVKTEASEVTEDCVEAQPLQQTDFVPEDNKENNEVMNSSMQYSQCETRQRSARPMANVLRNSEDCVEAQPLQQTDFVPEDNKENNEDMNSSTQYSQCETRQRSARSMANVLRNSEDCVEAQPLQQTDFVPEDNKENNEDMNSSMQYSQCETRQRSARPMANVLRNSNESNDSFLNLERALNIASKQSVTPIVSRRDCTPVTSKYKNKKTGRPWEEYMALKSRMSCLLTPNVKRFNSIELGNSMHSETNGTSLSHKIFADLHNLYSDSPDL